MIIYFQIDNEREFLCKENSALYQTRSEEIFALVEEREAIREHPILIPFYKHLTFFYLQSKI